MWSRVDLRGKGYHLLELELAGRVLRYCDAPTEQTITDAAGRSFVYLPGLVTSGASALQGIALEASVGITIDDDTDWALIEARDVYIEQRNGTLRRWFMLPDGTGQTLEQAQVLLRGISTQVAYGAASEPLEFSLSRSLRYRSRIVPVPQWRINDTTFPDAGNYSHDERVRGARMALLFGYPGVRATSTPRPAAPALLVENSDTATEDDDKVCIAGHRVTASSARIFTYLDGKLNSALISVSHVTDGVGQTRAVCNLNGSGLVGSDGTVNSFRGVAFYQGHTAATGGGIADPRTGALLRGAGSVMRYMLETYSKVKIDSAQMDVAAEYLDAFKIDCAIFQPVRAWDWVQSKLVPILPITLREGQYGIYPQVWRWNATGIHAIDHLDADKGHIRRVSSVHRVGDPRNEFAIHYRRDVATGQFRASAGLAAEKGRFRQGRWQDRGDIDSRIYGSELCAASDAKFGTHAADDISTDVVWDPATAALILQWRAARDAWPRRVIQYEADPEMEYLPLGAIVRLTDAELHLSSRLAMLTDHQRGPGSVLLTLTVLDDPLAHARSTV